MPIKLNIAAAVNTIINWQHSAVHQTATSYALTLNRHITWYTSPCLWSRSVRWFFHSHAFTEMFIVNGKSHCCNDTFTDVRFTSLLAKNIYEEYKLFLCCKNQYFIVYFVWNFHSNWLLFLTLSGCFFLNKVYIISYVMWYTLVTFCISISSFCTLVFHVMVNKVLYCAIVIVATYFCPCPFRTWPRCCLYPVPAADLVHVTAGLRPHVITNAVLGHVLLLLVLLLLWSTDLGGIVKKLQGTPNKVDTWYVIRNIVSHQTCTEGWTTWVGDRT